MNGSLVNFFAIVIGGLTGMVLRMGIPEKSKKTILQAMGLVVVIIGIKMALVSRNTLVVVVSMAVGTVIGEFLDLQGKLDRCGEYLTSSIGDRYGDAGRGFVMATLVFCIGAMAIVGSLQEGLTGDASVLYAKSLIDGICSVVFAASMGIGVLLSAVPVFLYQGGMTLAASSLDSVVNEVMLAEISGSGGIMILAIGLNMLEITKIRLANLLPALLVAAVLAGANIF